MYKKCFAKRLRGNNFLIHLWEDEGYKQIEWASYAYKECSPENATHKGLKNEPLLKTLNYKNGDKGLHFHDMTPHKKFLVERYGTNDEVSTSSTKGTFVFFSNGISNCMFYCFYL